MSDLISRGDVINLLCILYIDNVTVNGKRVTEYIRELPTAYDVDKVVAELTRESLVRIDGNNEIYLDDAIDIVRKGGINETD